MIEESDRYRVPLTVLPAVPDGVIVTGMVTLWPGSTTYGVKPAVALMADDHRSPVGAETPPSKAAVTADMDRSAVIDLAAAGPVGPVRNGVMLQMPGVTSGTVRLPVAV